MDAYSKNHAKHMNIFCGQNAEFFFVKQGGTSINTRVTQERNLSVVFRSETSVR